MVLNRSKPPRGISDRDRKFLKSLIPSMDEKNALDYDQLRREREAEVIDTQEIDAKALLLGSIEFYNQNYPKSKIEKVWSNKKVSIKVGADTLDNELVNLTEEELFGVQEIYDYCHDERFIKTIIDHTKMQYSVSKIQKLIPGFQYRAELIKMDQEETEREKRRTELRKKIKVAQEKFAEKLNQVTKIEPVPTPNPETNKVGFECPECGKVCKTKGALGSHLHTHRG